MSESPQVAPLPGLLKLSVDDIALVACEAAMLVDGSQTIVAANSAAERLLRHAPGSLQGQALSTLLPRAVRSTHDQLVRRFAESASPEARMADRTSVVALRGDASEIALDIYLWRMDVPVEGRPHRLYLVLMRDPSIEPTLRRQVAALNQRFRAVLDMAPVAMWVAEDKQVVFANRAAHALFDMPDGRHLVGRPVQELVSPDAWSELQAQMLRAQQADHGGPPVQGRIQRADGSVRDVEIGTAALPDHGQTVLQMVINDVTEHRQRQQSQRVHRAELRRLSASVVEAREEERRRIARELHDELGQRLSGVKLELSSLAATQQASDTRTKIDAMLAMIDDTVASVRRISSDLRPLILDDLGLNAAIESLARDASRRMGIEVTVRLGDDDPPVTDRVAIAVYRMVQEALTNVGRHARATDVRVELKVDGSDLVLRVRDNGIGFPERPRSQEGRFGLLGIRERAYMLGGELKVDNPAGGGGRLTVRLPIGAPVGKADAEGTWQ